MVPSNGLDQKWMEEVVEYSKWRKCGGAPPALTAMAAGECDGEGRRESDVVDVRRRNGIEVPLNEAERDPIAQKQRKSEREA